MNPLRFSYLLFYAMVGAHLPYYPLYLSARGFTPAQIGILVGAQGFSVLFMPLVSGLLSDTRTGAALFQKKIFTICCGLLLLLTAMSSNFWILLPLSVLMGLSLNPIFSLIDGAAVAIITSMGRSVDQDFVTARAWGSVGFIVPTVVFVLCSEFWAVSYAQMLLLGVIFAGLFLVCLQWFSREFSIANNFAVAKEDQMHAINHPLVRAFKTFFHRDHRCFFIGTFGVATAMGAYYSMFSILLQRQGVLPTQIGIIYNIGVVAEVVVLFSSKRFLRWAGIWVGMLIAAIGSVFRFFTLSFSSSLTLIVVSQLTHATIILGIAVISSMYISAISEKKFRYSLFSVYQMTHSGVGRMVGAMVLPILAAPFVKAKFDILHAAFGMAAVLSLISLVSVCVGAYRVKIMQ